MGIATRMRGLGNVGIHKYNHCKTVSDVQKVNPNYKNDLTIRDWNYKLDNLTNADNLFKNGSIERFNADLPKCTSANYMFERNSYLNEINGDFPLITSARYMFWFTGLRQTKDNYPNITSANGMFEQCTLLTTSSAKFPSATAIESTFNGCVRLCSFYGAFPKGTYGLNVFYNNYNLSIFDADLPSLTNAQNMFNGTILNKTSVLRIANSIPTYTSGTHNIIIGIQKSLETDEEVLAAIELIKSKGWTVTTQWNRGYNGLEVLSNELNEKMELGIELPEGYTRLYYLEDFGRQWIDTEYIPTVNTGLYVIGKQITAQSGSFSYPVGVISNATDGNSQGIMAPTWGRNSSVYCGCQYNTNYSFGGNGRGEAYEGWINFLNDKVFKIIAKEIVNSRTVSSHSRVFSHSIWMFTPNIPNNTTTNKKSFNGRIYRVKISEGTEIVRDYVPALDPNGRPCMFELYEQKPYYNENPKEEFWYDFPPTNSN